MAEYISKESAISILEAKAEMAVCAPAQPYFHKAAKMIELLPAADVVPARHGRWYGDTCTSCNLPWNYNMTQNAEDWGYFDPMPDYCPNCGAKMDGGND